MDKSDLIISEPKEGNIQIQGIKCKVKFNFPASAFEKLYEIDTEIVSDCISYVRSVILNNMTYEAEIDENSISEDCCLEYIEQLRVNDSGFAKVYNTFDNDQHGCVRFILAYKEILDRTAENIAPALLQFADMIGEMQDVFFKSIKPALDGMQTMIVNYQNLYKDNLLTLFNQVSSFFNILINERSPKLSEEDKQKIIARYQIWGDYGWTSSEFLSQELLDYSPKDKSDADRIARRILNKKGVDVLFKRLETTIKKTDLSELKTCYTGKNYKACVLISFAIIDAKLIRLQGKEYPCRKPGNTAIKRFAHKYNSDIKRSFVLSLSYYNLINCLNKTFEDSNNFKKQPEVINRHFIAHGMLNRKIIQRDAIQAMLLVYNLYQLLDFIDEVRSITKT